jgi:DNA repair protein RadD
MSAPYSYQVRACREVGAAWSNGARSVLLVSPPGSGKTEMAMDLLGERRVLWVVHTRDLAHQAAQRLRARFGDDAVSIVAAGYHERPGARITVGTVQSLLEHAPLIGIELAVLDEAHHYRADRWGAVRDLYGLNALELGLTATPERDDGKPLGDIFEQLVVAASYSELLASGHIVPVRVIQPIRDLGGDYAQHPVDAWAEFSESSLTFAFFPLLQTAAHYARQWQERGVNTETIFGETNMGDRAAAFDAFEQGTCRVLSTVSTMLEGVNVPSARTVLLGRSFDFIGVYLQATGRGIRAHEGKEDCICIDLTGASIRHGSPVQDREYSLTGKAMSGPSRPGVGGCGGIDEPEVIGCRMRLAERGALAAGAPLPPGLSLPEPDPRRAERDRAVKAMIRTIRTKHGRGAAEFYQQHQERFR